MADHDWKVAENIHYIEQAVAYSLQDGPATSNVGVRASNFSSYKSSMLRNVTQSLGRDLMNIMGRQVS
jgi:hypothetical protein